jgi:hypothetical protein
MKRFTTKIAIAVLVGIHLGVARARSRARATLASTRRNIRDEQRPVAIEEV